jgi:hypothetical protein
MKSGAPLAILLLGALLALPPLAHASPTDPTWIPGFYDDNDYDDIILFITGAVTAVDTRIADASGLVAVCLGLITPSRLRPLSARPLRSLSTRAPPLLLS